MLGPPAPKVFTDGFTKAVELFQGSMLLEATVHTDDERPDLGKPIVFIEFAVICKMQEKISSNLSLLITSSTR